MDIGSRRVQIVRIVLAVLMAVMLVGTLWAYRPVSLAEAADARIGLEPKVAVVVRLDEMGGDAHTSYEAYNPTLLEQMELLVGTTRLRPIRQSSIAPLDSVCKIVIISEDNIICSSDYNLATNSVYIGNRTYAPRSTQSAPLSELVSAACGEVQVVGLRRKYLWPGLVLVAALVFGLGAALWFLRPAPLGERIGVAEGASLRQVVVEHGNGGGHGSHESDESALLAELSPLLADTQLHYDGFTDGDVPAPPAAYTVTVYFAPAEGGCTFGVDSQGCVYQDNRCYSTSPEQAEESTAPLGCICS